MSTARTTRTATLLQHLTLSAALLGAAAAAHAQTQTSDAHEMRQHPAIEARALAPAVDGNHFIVQPPASTRWVRARANGEHPAVLVSRQSVRLDANTFSVQPPATATWTVMPSEAATLVAVHSAGVR